jgi:hypothetical protein
MASNEARASFERSGIPMYPRAAGSSLSRIEWGLRLSGSRYFVNFELLKVAAWNLDGEAIDWGQGGEPARGDVPFEEGVAVLSGFVKWDGCTEVRFGPPGGDGQEHFCSAAKDAAELAIMWHWALRKAHELILSLDGHPDWEPVQEPPGSAYFESSRGGAPELGAKS